MLGAVMALTHSFWTPEIFVSSGERGEMQIDEVRGYQGGFALTKNREPCILNLSSNLTDILGR